MTAAADRPLRAALLAETFAPEMGYLQSVLPKYLARAGIDTHVIALDLPPYHGSRDWAGHMPEFVAQQAQPAGSERELDGYHVHILPHGKLSRFAYARGLYACLAKLRPDVVYSIGAIGPLPLQAAAYKARLGYKLFTGNHTSAAVFPLANAPELPLNAELLKVFALRFLPGRAVSLLTERCYCRTAGCADIARRFFGVQARKIDVVPLGVDTDYFYPIRSDADRSERAALRRELGVAENEVLCINTGRLIATKDLSLLARAIASLRAQGWPLRALFIGDGPEREQLAAAPHCQVLAFRPFKQLGGYYRAADIAVWPAGESTSMFDAAACGVPLLVSDAIDAHLDGNGLSFATHDETSLREALRALCDPERRAPLGARGARLMRERLDWQLAAATRARDFRAAVERS